MELKRIGVQMAVHSGIQMGFWISGSVKHVTISTLQIPNGIEFTMLEDIDLETKASLLSRIQELDTVRNAQKMFTMEVVN